MALDLPHQQPDAPASAGFINQMAGAVEQHDLALEQAIAHPHCVVLGTGALVVPNTSNFFLPWTAAESDALDMWVSGDTVTIPRNGVYFLGASATWLGTATAGIRVVQIWVGGAMRIESRLPTGVGGNLLTQCPATTAYLTAGTGIRVLAYQSSGGPLNLDSVTRRLTVTKWGP